MANNKPIGIEAFKNILKEGIISELNEAEYKGKDVELNKPFRTAILKVCKYIQHV